MKPKVFPRPEDENVVRHGSIERVPANVSFLSPIPCDDLQHSSIGFKWHSSTQHLSIENYQPPSYYEDYLMTASYSDKMQALQKSQVKKLLELHEGASGPQSFVEIGCGDGSFLKHARGQIPRILGIEPSRSFAKEASLAGFEVLNGYVGSTTRLTTEKFDCFASRQVFEHLPDPVDVLVGIREMLNAGAVGLIEVPNGYRALRLKRFFEFFPDHVHYYSVNSLVALASDVGFNVISCQENFGGDYLELWLRFEPSVESWFGELKSRREQICSEIASKVQNLHAQGKRVAIWGCGAKTLSILAASPKELLSNIAGIIDSDPHKNGRYVPNTAIEVVAPERASGLKPDVVFVFALSYRAEIAAAIRQLMPNCQEIFTLDDDGHISRL